MKKPAILILLLTSVVAADARSANAGAPCSASENDAPTAYVDARRIEPNKARRGCVSRNDVADTFVITLPKSMTGKDAGIYVEVDGRADVTLRTSKKDDIVEFGVGKGKPLSQAFEVNSVTRTIWLRVSNSSRKNVNYRLIVTTEGYTKEGVKKSRPKLKPTPRPIAQPAARPKRKKKTCQEFDADSIGHPKRATAIGVGAFEGCLTVRDERDGFRISVPEGKNFNLKVSNESAESSIYLGVFNTSGSGAKSTLTLSNFKSKSFLLKGGDSYFVRLKAFSTETVDYSISVVEAK